MFIATVIASLSLGVAHFDDKPIKCAVMGSATNAKSMSLEYEGAKYPMCCGGCPAAFTKDPGQYIEKAAKSDTTIGVFMFDPVSGVKLDWEKTTVSTDVKGMRYGFANEGELKTFKAESDKFIKTPKKESLTCANSGEKIDAYSAAGGYMDYKGVRYYFCCPDCLAAMKKDPEAVVAKGKAVVAEPKVMPTPKAK